LLERIKLIHEDSDGVMGAPRIWEDAAICLGLLWKESDRKAHADQWYSGNPTAQTLAQEVIRSASVGHQESPGARLSGQ